jgi:hypothetical protein
MRNFFRGAEGKRRRLLAVALIAFPATGCGGDTPTAEPSSAVTSTAPGATPAEAGPDEPAGKAIRAPACPPELANCDRASGTILYVERVDPDGDGDAHFVLLSGDGITAPGISVIDVRRALRPRPLPGPGDRLAAAGPVYPGSRGQLQIEAVVVRTGRP